MSKTEVAGLRADLKERDQILTFILKAVKAGIPPDQIIMDLSPVDHDRVPTTKEDIEFLLQSGIDPS
jgi:hypothetical protein